MCLSRPEDQRQDFGPRICPLCRQRDVSLVWMDIKHDIHLQEKYCKDLCTYVCIFMTM